MGKRFLFYRVDGKTGRMTVTAGDQLIVDILADKTEAALSRTDPAVTGTEGTEELIIGILTPPARYFIIGLHP